MPELPEVETIKSELLPRLIGRQFSQVIILDARVVRHPSVSQFCQKLAGQRIGNLKRRGKYLLFYLSGAEVLIIHLMMAGALLLNPKQAERYTRAIFQFDDGSQIVFTDRRRLGALWLAENEATVVGKLGPEPLASDFTAQVLKKWLQGRQAPIKALLLDQTFIAGIGNMYADEALLTAQIHPLKKANNISSKEVKSLHHAIQGVLKSAVGNKGASIDAYIRPGGELGTAHFSFRVAHRGGKPCPICGSTIQRISLRNRGSYFCPNCQKLS